MTENPTSLYTAWLDALPKAFGALTPGFGGTIQALAPGMNGGKAPAGTATADGGSHKGPPFPADQIAQALKVLEGTLTQLYLAWLPQLADGKLTAEPLQAMSEAAAKSFEPVLGALRNPVGALPKLMPWLGLEQATQPWAALVQPLADDSHPTGPGSLQLGFERTYGGLGEALGLGPVRELNQALREMLATEGARQQATAEYLAVVAGACVKGTEDLLKELKAMGARGERVESLLVFIRLWVKSIDGPMHDAMQSERGLEVTAQVLRAMTEHRLKLQKAVGIVSEALDIPTRGEIDDAYREIQELKRELRRLKRSAPVPGRMALPAASATSQPAAVAVGVAAPARKAATRKSSRSRETQT